MLVKNKSLIKSIFALVIFLALTSCEKFVDIPLKHSGDVYFVVEGRITDETKKHTIRLSTTLPYFANRQCPTVDNAQVEVTEKGTNIKYKFIQDSASNGSYLSELPFKGKIGETYILNIACSMGDYTSEAYLDSVPAIDSLNYEYKYYNFGKDPEGYYILKFSGQEIPLAQNYFMFKLHINDTVYNTTLEDTPIQDDKFIDGVYLPDVEVFYIHQEAIMDSINQLKLDIYSISKDEYNFNLAFKTEANGNSMFSGPPSNIPTNIINVSGQKNVLGFFGASAIVTSEIELNRIHDLSTNLPEFLHKYKYIWQQ